MYLSIVNLWDKHGIFRLLHTHQLQRSKHENEDVDLMESAPQTLDDEDDIVDDDLNDNDAAAAKLREKQQEERDYDGEDEEKQEVDELDSGNIDCYYHTWI